MWSRYGSEVRPPSSNLPAVGALGGRGGGERGSAGTLAVSLDGQQLPRLPAALYTLTALDLSCNALTDAGVEALCAALR